MAFWNLQSEICNLLGAAEASVSGVILNAKSPRLREGFSGGGTVGQAPFGSQGDAGKSLLRLLLLIVPLLLLLWLLLRLLLLHPLLLLLSGLPMLLMLLLRRSLMVLLTALLLLRFVLLFVLLLMLRERRGNCPEEQKHCSGTGSSNDLHNDPPKAVLVVSISWFPQRRSLSPAVQASRHGS